MNCSLKRHSRIINRIPLKNLGEKIKGGAQPIISFIDRDVASWALILNSNDCPFQGFGIVGRVNRSPFLWNDLGSPHGISLWGKPRRLSR
jgi:hypothetical protein